MLLNLSQREEIMQAATSKIQERGNTTIPQSVRDYLKLDKGASIVYTFKPNGKVEIEKVTAQQQKQIDDIFDALDNINDALKAQGVTFEQLMQTGKEERKKLFNELPLTNL